MNWLFFMCWHANGNSPPKDNTIPRNLKLSDLFLFNFFSLSFHFLLTNFTSKQSAQQGVFLVFAWALNHCCSLHVCTRFLIGTIPISSAIFWDLRLLLFSSRLCQNLDMLVWEGDCNACEVTPGWSRTLLIFGDCSPQIKMFLFLLKTEQLHTMGVQQYILHSLHNSACDCMAVKIT